MYRFDSNEESVRNIDLILIQGTQPPQPPQLPQPPQSLRSFLIYAGLCEEAKPNRNNQDLIRLNSIMEHFTINFSKPELGTRLKPGISGNAKAVAVNSPSDLLITMVS